MSRTNARSFTTSPPGSSQGKNSTQDRDKESKNDNLNELTCLLKQVTRSNLAISNSATTNSAERKPIEKGTHLTCLNCAHSEYWTLDSGTIDNMIACIDLLFNIVYDNPSIVRIADGSTMKVIGYISIYIGMNTIIHNVLYVSKCKSNLLSIDKLTLELNCCVIFGEKAVVIMNGTTLPTIGESGVHSGLYIVRSRKNKGKDRHISMFVSF